MKTGEIFSRIKKVFPTEKDCIGFVEGVVWGSQPICPYCRNYKVSLVANEGRYHCNSCNVRFTVTVGTPFHRSKVELRKWLTAIVEEESIGPRGLASEIGTTKDTAALIISKLRKCNKQERAFINKLREKAQEVIY